MQDAQSAASAEAYRSLVDLVGLTPDADGDRPGLGDWSAEVTVDAGGWSSLPSATHSPRG